MIKCHFCKHELEEQYGANVHPNHLECPNGHAKVYLNGDGEIIDYVLFWDVDPDANERYKLVGMGGGTFLHYSSQKANAITGHWGYRKYQCIFSSNTFITIAIKENTIQMDNLVMRLKKMGVFS